MGTGRLGLVAAERPEDSPAVLARDELVRALGERGIRSLDEIKATPGFRYGEGLPVGRDHPALRALDSYANLIHLTPKFEVVGGLIRLGIESIAAIAMMSRAEFVRTTHALMGDSEAAQLHVRARAVSAYLDGTLREALRWPKRTPP